MRTLNSLIGYTILVGLLASCATSNPDVRLNPKETKTAWDNGKEFTSYFKDGFIVHCAYHGTTDAHMVFNIEVVNTTDEDFLLCPEKIVMFTDSGKWDPVTNQIVYGTFPIFAIDSEIEILNNELAVSQLEANKKILLQPQLPLQQCHYR